MEESARSPAGAPGERVLSPGHRLGKYQLVRRIAVGGMAELYLARATGIEGFEKLVALKRILPQYAEQEDFIRMFLDEARLAATLQHPNIAQVYDIGCVAGSYFFTMEYVHGQDVLEVLRAARRLSVGLPLETAITIVLGVCAGLHHAHDKRGADGRPLGIVHRDVSPSNVLVTYDGSVKVVDFGIAKMAIHEGHTRVGTLKGKISYMSPEQCRGEPLDRRSDVFAIGILLYELTTGCRLFYGENELATLNRIVSGTIVPPSARRPDFDPDLETIVLRALRTDRDERFPTAQDLQLALEGFAREHKLVVSAIALARFMETLFREKFDAWREAQQAGVSLVDHLTQILGAEPAAGSAPFANTAVPARPVTGSMPGVDVDVESGLALTGTGQARLTTPTRTPGLPRPALPLPAPPTGQVAIGDPRQSGPWPARPVTDPLAPVAGAAATPTGGEAVRPRRHALAAVRDVAVGAAVTGLLVLAITFWPRHEAAVNAPPATASVAADATPRSTAPTGATGATPVASAALDAAPAAADAGARLAGDAAVEAPKTPGNGKRPPRHGTRPKPPKKPGDTVPEWHPDSPLPP